MNATPSLHRLVGLLIAALTLMGASAAVAHPHVWVDAAAEVVFDDDGSIAAIRHAWRFDEAFSSYLMLGLDTNGDGLYSREETAELAEVNVTSLADFHFFTSMAGAATTDRVGDLFSETFGAPEDYYLEHDGVHTTLHFTLPLETSVDANAHDLVILDIFDPEYFVAFSLVENDPIQLANAPSGCALSVDEPPPLDDSYASILSLIPAEEAVPEELLSVTEQLANRARIVCT
ncbi:MAG: DUF1007 family protein [Hyphomicrobiales bacterium]|jgi:ABC-type uncharacterized transport system substrate-binding protein